MGFFEFERCAVIDVVADVFLIRENLVDGRAGPLAPEVGEDAAFVQLAGDLGLWFSGSSQKSVGEKAPV